jgi:hypothetical protein
MGTFHQDRSPLHGITVVVDTAGPDVYVGRCDDEDDERVILLDADSHREAEGAPSKQEYVRKAARLGVWKRHQRLVLPRGRVTSIRPLGDF